MTTFLRNPLSNSRTAIIISIAFAASVAGCGAPAPSAPEDTGQAALVSSGGSLAETTSAALDARRTLVGPWKFASSDIAPSTSYKINGNEIDLNFNGNFTWNGTWATGYEGYSFDRRVALKHGATYELTLSLSNVSNPIPVVLSASLSGAGAEQSQTFFNGTTTAKMTFAVSSPPGARPVLELTAHPVLGHLGPTEGIGVGVQSYGVTASLVRTH